MHMFGKSIGVFLPGEDYLSHSQHSLVVSSSLCRFEAHGFVLLTLAHLLILPL